MLICMLFIGGILSMIVPTATAAHTQHEMGNCMVSGKDNEGSLLVIANYPDYEKPEIVLANVNDEITFFASYKSYAGDSETDFMFYIWVDTWLEYIGGWIRVAEGSLKEDSQGSDWGTFATDEPAVVEHFGQEFRITIQARFLWTSEKEQKCGFVRIMDPNMATTPSDIGRADAEDATGGPWPQIWGDQPSEDICVVSPNSPTEATAQLLLRESEESDYVNIKAIYHFVGSADPIETTWRFLIIVEKRELGLQHNPWQYCGENEINYNERSAIVEDQTIWWAEIEDYLSVEEIEYSHSINYLYRFGFHLWMENDCNNLPGYSDQDYYHPMYGYGYTIADHVEP